MYFPASSSALPLRVYEIQRLTKSATAGGMYVYSSLYYLDGMDAINERSESVRYWSALLSDGFGWDAPKASDRSVKFLYSTTLDREAWKLLQSTKSDDRLLYTAFLSKSGYILLVWVPNEQSGSIWDSISQLEFLSDL